MIPNFTKLCELTLVNPAISCNPTELLQIKINFTPNVIFIRNILKNIFTPNVASRNAKNDARNMRRFARFGAICTI